MGFSWDKNNDYNSVEYPTLTLAYPDKREIGAVQYSALSADILFNGISEITFETYKYEDNILQECYQHIENFMLVKADGVGWFQISSSTEDGDGLNEKKTVTAKSLENEFSTKMVTSFGELGTEDDEQGGLDMYWLYKPDDKEHSILHIIQEKCPSWAIGHVDPDITEQPRSISEDSISAYNLMVDKASELFECVFQFDTYNQTINVYKLENIGDKTNIYLSYNNLINTRTVDCSIDEIKTVLYVTGGNNSLTGSNLDIISVNPAGSNCICDFTYYRKMMSDELKCALDNYENAYNNSLEDYQAAINELNTLYDEYYDLQNKVPSSVETNSLENLIAQINESTALPSDINNSIKSVNWDLYGLTELQNYYDAFEQRMSLYTGTFKSNDGSDNEKRYQMNYSCLISVKTNLDERSSEVKNKENTINLQLETIKSLQVHIEDYVDGNLMSELKRFWHEDTYVDDTCVATSEMTDSEITEMKCELLKAAQEKLAKVSRPQVQIDVNSDNFIEIPEFEVFKNELELGNIITLELDDEIILELRLLKIHYNWTDKTDFKLTFSNKSSLDDTIDMFAEIREQANASSGFIGINGVGVKSAKAAVSEFNKYKSSVLNASLQKLQSGDNIEFEINSTGTKWRRWDDSINDYEPYQMWGTGNGLYLTQDNWESLSMAIGKMTIDGDIVYGVSCDVLMGDFVLTKHLSISNTDSSFTIGADGFVATNGTNTLIINPNDTKLFQISKGTEQKIYFDSDGEAFFNGNVTALKGNIGGWTISDNGLYCSDSSANQGIGLWKDGVHKYNNKYIALHAGSDINHIGSGAEFKLYYDGTLETSNIIATGGTIGGWTIDSNSIYNSKSGMSSNTSGRYAFWAGETNSSYGTKDTNAPFKVDHYGQLFAKNAEIEGKITATSGTFNNVTIANSCTIAGRTFGAGFTWEGTPVVSQYITTSLSGKSLTSCTVPDKNAFTIGNGSLASGVAYNDGTSTYGMELNSGASAFRIKIGDYGIFQFNSTGAVFSGSLTVGGLAVVSGGNKKRIIKTKNFGNKGLQAYETPTPLFGDCGTGKLDENGVCYISIDPIFAETVQIDKKYIISLTKYGAGDIFADMTESNNTYFTVKGTPNLTFSWEIKFPQGDIDDERWGEIYDLSQTDTDDSYENMAVNYLEHYERSIENV